MMNRITLLIAGALMSFLLIPASFAQDTNGLRSKVETLLGGIEAEPTHEQFVAIGPDAPLALGEIAQDRKMTLVTRGRAISALANYPSVATSQTVRVLLIDPQTPSLLRRKAIFTLSSVEGAQCLELLKPYLAAQEFDLREASIHALGRINTVESRNLLLARQPFEKSSDLQATIAKELQRPVSIPTPEIK